MIFDFLKKIKSKRKIKPTTVIIDISNRCNAQCQFCARQLSAVKRNDLMTEDMFLEIMKQIKKIKSVKEIALAAWGEAMLHPSFDKFIDIVTNAGYKVNFPTNLSLANKHFESMLKADYIIFSIEGSNKSEYETLRKNLNFETTFNNVKDFDKIINKYRKNGHKTPKRILNFIATKNSNIDEFISLWSNYVDEIRVAPILPVMLWNKEKGGFDLQYNDEIKDKIINCDIEIKNMKCSQPFTTIVIRPNGKLALCCSDFDIDINFGDYKNLYKTFQNNKNLNKVRSEFSNNNLSVCKYCFQSYGVSEEKLLEMLPQLKKYKDNNKVKIFTNR
ncbi:MAG: radical SAM protein [Clostridiaceae bacterium]|jgi:MoaA/NifB/PqqE/SkfB family radical SAM enzyme|nr:radical SAM protein [Clostridiaceae bacterium]